MLRSSLFCSLAVTVRAASGIPGPLDDASMSKFYIDSTTRGSASAIAACQEYPDGSVIPWGAVVKDWSVGGRPEDCAAALIVAAGETSCTRAGCLSVESGIWQVTSPDMPAPSGCKDGDTNPCCTVDYVRNHIDTRIPGSSKTTSYQIGCIGEFNDGNGWAGDPSNPNATLPPSTPLDPAKVVGRIVPSDHSGAGLGGTQSNWIGPFCHQGGFSCESNDPYCHSHSQTGISGDNWGGGSEWIGSGQGQQIYPFPYYYYAQFVASQGDGTGMTGDMHCNTAPIGGRVGSCGGVPSQGLPDCNQPASGQAPSDQQCLDRITDLAIKLATSVCSSYLP